ncbi:MAG: TonB family protein [Bacteroidales bacterium]|nr:TonB family protein [Bacteroidales bacterium]
MSKLTNIYRNNIYGVMGTLTFHIILLGLMLVSGMAPDAAPAEEYIAVELPDESVPEPPAKEPEPQKERPLPPEQAPNTAPAVSNRAVNDALTKEQNSMQRDRMLDDDYRKEVADAERLVADVNKQLSKKTPQIDDTPMPEDVTDGKKPEDISNTVYSGESNIHYELDNPPRYHRKLPIPVYLARGGGKVTVDIWVATDGRVTRAEVRTAPASDPLLSEYARRAATKTLFNADRNAPNPQKGYIIYTFVAQ